jgi:hypothetical protein
VEVFHDTLEEIKPLKRWNVNFFFFLSSLKRDVAKLVDQCQTCQLAMHRK